MQSIWHRQIVFPIAFTASAIAIGLMDWKHFYPLSSHSDLGFQSTGECLEIFVTAGLFALAFFGFSDRRRSGSVAKATPKNRLTAGAIFVMLDIVIGWRDFFPGDHFRLSAGTNALVGSLILGAAFAFFLNFDRPKSKPSKEEGQSVA